MCLIHCCYCHYWLVNYTSLVIKSLFMLASKTLGYEEMKWSLNLPCYLVLQDVPDFFFFPPALGLELPFLQWALFLVMGVRSAHCYWVGHCFKFIIGTKVFSFILISIFPFSLYFIARNCSVKVTHDC